MYVHFPFTSDLVCQPCVSVLNLLEEELSLLASCLLWLAAVLCETGGIHLPCPAGNGRLALYVSGFLNPSRLSHRVYVRPLNMVT